MDGRSARPPSEALGLLGSLVAEERKGDPRASRVAAVAAAAREAERSAGHLLDAALSGLVGGEPRWALSDLDRAAGAPTDDGSIGQLIAVARAWAHALDLNWYPGGVGAEIGEADIAQLGAAFAAVPTATTDPDVVLLLAVAGPLGYQLLSWRSLVAGAVRQHPAAAEELLAHAIGAVAVGRASAERAGDRSLAAYAGLAAADLVARAGRIAEARALAGQALGEYNQAGDLAGVGACLLALGDWLAAPGASPETLGFDLEGRLELPAIEGLPDVDQAKDAFEEAARVFARAGAVRGLGAVALRHGFLAWRAGDFASHLERATEAEGHFSAAGDEAGRRLARVHQALATIAAGHLGQLRLSAGAGWARRSLDGPLAEIAPWAETRGSRSYAAGLARLFHRAGLAWREDGDVERARVALAIATELVIALGWPRGTAAPLADLADLHSRLNLRDHAIVTYERALADRVRYLSGERAADGVAWMEHCHLAMGIFDLQVAAQNAGGIEAAGRRLEWLGAGVAGAGRPGEATDPLATLAQDRRMLVELREEMAHKTLDTLAREAGGDTSATERRMLEATRGVVLEQSRNTRVLVPLYRATDAERTGRAEDAERGYERALDEARALGAAGGFFEVNVLASWGRIDEARTRLNEVLSRLAGAYSVEHVAGLYAQLGDFAAAGAELARLDANPVPSPAPRPWEPLLLRAEVAAGLGRFDEAAALVGEAIQRFERVLARLVRDAFKTAACDDINVGWMYLVAARTWLAVADRPTGRDGMSREDALARSFELGERGRALALIDLLNAAARATDEGTRSWQRLSAEWSAAYDRLVHALGASSREDTALRPLVERLDAAEQSLAAAEARLEETEPGFLTAARHLPPPARLGDIRAALPEDTLLLQYHLVRGDLLAWGVDHHRVVPHHRSVPGRALAGTLRRFHRACATGTGPPADLEVLGTELVALLLEPFRRELEVYRRLLIVPFGPLHVLPFQALPFDGGPLGTTHDLSYLPAASLVTHVGGRHRPRLDGRALVVGDPAFTPAARPRLRRLRGAAVEARLVAGAVGADVVLLGEDATEARLRDTLPGRRLLHLAAHGQLDEVAPTASSIVLAGADELSVADLMGIGLDADLAVLSACDSGRGETTLGGEVVGLTRGLLAAGVRSAIVSLWPVDDDVACVTMAHFYERLAHGDDTAVALAKAQRHVRGLDADQLAAACAGMGVAAEDGSRRAGRRGPTDMPLEFRDEGDAPERATGAEPRFWAPFIHIGI